jgi:hypothetical protein
VGVVDDAVDAAVAGGSRRGPDARHAGDAAAANRAVSWAWVMPKPYMGLARSTPGKAISTLLAFFSKAVRSRDG